MKNRLFICLCGLLTLCLAVPLHAQVSFGNAQRFNEGWLFKLEDDSTYKQNTCDDAEWRKLDLPHDWSIEGQLSPDLASCTGYLPGGIGWYRKHFSVINVNQVFISVFSQHFKTKILFSEAFFISF